MDPVERGSDWHSRACRLLLVALGAYLFAYLLSYLGSPFGRVAVLDGAENVSLARRIAGGTLAAEPFYRAMLYPTVLSLFVRAGVPVEWLPVMAACLGVALHAGSTICVFFIARRVWDSERAGGLAAALYGFNPVAVYFALEPLDTTLGLFLFLAGTNLLHATLAQEGRRARSARPTSGGREWFDRGVRYALGGVALWSLATLARPHYAIVLAGLPVLFVAELWKRPRRLILFVAGYVLVAGMCLGAAGLVQKRVCGPFRVMPAQGAYNLWAGNRPGANGRYFEQKLHIAAGTVAEGENPTRVESEILYRKEAGVTGALDVDRMNAYWNAKTKEAIRSEPGAWLGLMARKVYYLFNNFEQYNNKTFAVQKALSPVLRWNPLGWGVTLVICVGGVVGAWGARAGWGGVDKGGEENRLHTSAPTRSEKFAGAAFLVGAAILYSAGVLMFFVSDRFRAPLLPFVCVGAGVWGCVSRGWLWALRGWRVGAVAVLVLLTGVLTFSRGWGVYDLSPAVQDYVLLSIASGKSGRDVDGLRWARRALEQRQDHPDALACAVQSFYNVELQGTALGPGFLDETWAKQAERAAGIPQPSAGIRLIRGVALWKTGRKPEAQAVWRSLADASASDQLPPPSGTTIDDALGALLLSGLAGENELSRAKARANDTASFYLLVALNRRGEGGASLVPEAKRQLVAQAEPFVKNIFP